jgi:integrase/recombinase XerD
MKMDNILLLSKSVVLQNNNDEYKISTMLKQLENEMKMRGFSQKTMKSYLYYNSKFLDFVNKLPKDVTKDDVKEFLSYKMDNGSHNCSANLIKSALKFYYSDILGINLTLIKFSKEERKLPIVLNKEEIKRLIDKTENMKHKLLIELLYSAGLRLSECINLKYRDLDINEGVGWVRQGKGGKDRIFMIADMFKRDLVKYQKDYGLGNNKDDFIFTVNGRKMSPRGMQVAIKISAERAGIEKDVHVHTLRHTYATHLLENGVDIRKIQKLLGHTNLATTQIYTQVSSEEIKKIKSPLDML